MTTDLDRPADVLGLRLDRYLDGYWNGAYLAHDRGDRPVVFKELPDEATFSEERVRLAISLEDTLRVEGYPAPEYIQVAVLDGRTYTVQEFITGDVPAVLEARHAQRVAELISEHAGRGSNDPTWAEQILGPLRPDDSHEQGLLRQADNPRRSSTTVVGRSRCTFRRIRPRRSCLPVTVS